MMATLDGMASRAMRRDVVVLTTRGLRTAAGGPRVVRSPRAWQSRRAEDAQGVCKRRLPYPEHARELHTRVPRAEAAPSQIKRAPPYLPSIPPISSTLIVVRASC